MRGEGQAKDNGIDPERITPACAGRSFLPEANDLLHKDHPRVCGEKTKKIPNISRFYPGAACFSFSFS